VFEIGLSHDILSVLSHETGFSYGIHEFFLKIARLASSSYFRLLAHATRAGMAVHAGAAMKLSEEAGLVTARLVGTLKPL
jgi:hypothetical protein